MQFTSFPTPVLGPSHTAEPLPRPVLLPADVFSKAPLLALSPLPFLSLEDERSIVHSL
jgi:hypothetical protein